jgi:hypothetical protein
VAYDENEAVTGGAIGGANDEPGTGPCGTRVVAAIVALLVLAWAASRFGTAARRPRRRRNSAAVNSPGEGTVAPPTSDRGKRCGAADGRR